MNPFSLCSFHGEVFFLFLLWQIAFWQALSYIILAVVFQSLKHVTPNSLGLWSFLDTSALILIGLPLYVTWYFSPDDFHTISLFFLFSGLIILWRMIVLQFCLLFKCLLYQDWETFSEFGKSTIICNENIFCEFEMKFSFFYACVCLHFCLLVVSWISENLAQIWLVYVRLVGMFQFFHLVALLRNSVSSLI